MIAPRKTSISSSPQGKQMKYMLYKLEMGGQMQMKFKVMLLLFVVFSLVGFSSFAQGIKEEPLDIKTNFPATTFPFKITAQADLGVAQYREKDLNIETDWDSILSRYSIGLLQQDNKDFESNTTFTYLATGSDKETWDVNEATCQTNDLEIQGFVFESNIGYALPIKYYSSTIADDEVLVFTPFVGYGYRRFNFERTNRNVSTAITNTETVSGDVDLHYINIGLRIQRNIWEKGELYCLVKGGLIVCSQVDNQNLGKVEGDGGNLLVGEIGIDYALTDNWTLSAGFSGERQRVRGGHKDSKIWATNTMFSTCGFLKISYGW